MAAFTTLQQSTLVQLYVGILGTTPTTAALNTYATIFASTSGSDAAKYDAVAAAMVASTAGQTKYPVFATAGQIADTMLGHLGLSGSAVGADGTTLKALAEGILAYPGVTVASFGRALLNALNTNTFTGTDQLSVAAAAAKTAYGVDTTTGAAGATLQTAVNTALGVTAPVTDPVSKAFTTAADALEGGAGNDTFTGSVLAATSPVGSGDKVDGKAGTDTVDIRFISDGASDLTLELTSVEKLKFQLFETMTASGALWDSSVQEVSIAGLADMDGVFNAVPKAVNFAVESSNASNKDLTATFIDLTGSSDSVAVSLKGTSSTVTLNQTANAGVLETVSVTIDQSGSGAATSLAGTAFSATTSLTITGDTEKGAITVNPVVGNVTLIDLGSGTSVTLGAAGNAALTADQTLNFASAATVAFTATIGMQGNKSITGGAQNDTITFTGSGSGNITANLGGGIDTITIPSTMVGAHSISGGDGNDVITITHAGVRNHTVDGGDGNDSITITGTGSSNVVVTGGTGIDTITISVNGQHSILGGDGNDSVIGSTFIGSDDTVDGGDGNDTISLTLATTAPTTTPTIRNVETIDITTGATGRRFDMSKADGVNTLNVKGSASTVLFTNVSGNKTLQFNEGPMSGANSVSFKSGAGSTLTVTGSGAAGGASITATNAASVVISANSATVANSGWSSALVNVDGNVTTSLQITTGGSAISTLALGSHSALTSLSLTHNGEGSLRVADLVSSDDMNLASVTLVAGVSADLYFGVSRASANSAGQYNFTADSTMMGGASGLSTLSITAGDQANVYVGGLSGNSTYFAPSISIAVGSGATVSVEKVAYSSINDNPLNGTIAITGAGVSGSTVTLGSAAGAISGMFYSTLSYTGGDVNIRMTSAGAATGLSGMSAAMTITSASGADLLLGGHGADTITSGPGSDTIYGGSGADVINPGSTVGDGSDHIILGGGVQTIQLRGFFTSTNTSVDYVSAFTAGSNGDVIDFTGTTSLNPTGMVTLSDGRTAMANLFSSAAGYEVRYASYGSAAASGAGGTGILDFKTASAFAMLMSTGSANGVDSLFSGSLAGFEGNSGYGIGFTGVSAAAALLIIQTGSATSAGSGAGPGASTAFGTYLVAIETSSTGSVTLGTANVVGQVFLSGVTAAMVIGNLG